MAQFSNASMEKLATCHPDLQRLFREVVKHVDCTIICGHRGEAEQNAAVAAGNSKVKWPTGKHNKAPSLAVDVMPCPVDWSGSRANIEHLTYFAGIVKGIALTMGISIRWGHDWDRDGKPDDAGFVDRPHYELVL
jgi:peptidoglycan L-alanyl-D-glutamate endopeptidase CwlK